MYILHTQCCRQLTILLGRVAWIKIINTFHCLNCSLQCPVRISHINTDLPITALSCYFNWSSKSHEFVPSLAEHEQASFPTLLTYNPYTPHLKIAMREIRRTLGATLLLRGDRLHRQFPVENGVALYPVPGQHFPCHGAVRSPVSLSFAEVPDNCSYRAY